MWIHPAPPMKILDIESLPTALAGTLCEKRITVELQKWRWFQKVYNVATFVGHGHRWRNENTGHVLSLIHPIATRLEREEWLHDYQKKKKQDGRI